jgi:hypothetical protein
VRNRYVDLFNTSSGNGGSNSGGSVGGGGTPGLTPASSAGNLLAPVFPGGIPGGAVQVESS